MSGDNTDKLRRIDIMHASLEKRDHFNLLGVDDEAPADTLRMQYLRLAKQWHEDSFVGVSLGERKRKLDDIFQRIQEAYETLSNAGKRAEYLVMLERQRQGLATDVASVLRAEGLVDEALGMMAKKQYGSARKSLEEAIRLNPDDPLYRVHLAWAIYMSNQKARPIQDEALGILKEAVKRQENMADAYKYAGQIHFDRNEYDAAIRWWRQCLKWDSKNTVAVRGIRLATTRIEKEKRSPLGKLLDKMLGRD
ncbi:MAG: DnaJ domain-containing protein [Myxococcales bacterium]|nr:DnaJ domain-containing protein [Myxococcales bacterium]